MTTANEKYTPISFRILTEYAEKLDELCKTAELNKTTFICGVILMLDNQKELLKQVKHYSALRAKKKLDAETVVNSMSSVELERLVIMAQAKLNQ